MRIRFPLKELIKYSVVLSMSITVFVAVMIYSQELDFIVSISRATVSGAVLLAASAISIMLIIRFERRNFTASAIHTKLRLVVGGLINVGFMFAYHFFRIWAEKHQLVPSVFSVSDEMQSLHGWQLGLLIVLPALMVYGLVHLLHNFILLDYLKTQTELEVSQLRSANAETNNLLLRQQVQPHFLFNALNVLKSLIKKDPKTAEAYLLRLSDFLRTSFTQHKKGIATVKEEIKLCRDYLEMQKMRFGDALEYTFDVPDKYMDGTLPFFSLQPLAENAIKHNELTDENPLSINIAAHDGVIRVENNLQRKISVEGSTGNGLSNLTERYKLLSGDTIQIADNDTRFSVAFKIIPA